jgi:hypothetical protein
MCWVGKCENCLAGLDDVGGAERWLLTAYRLVGLLGGATI